MDTDMSHIQVLGLTLVLLGLLLFLVPFLLEWMPSLEKVPWIILYVYRSDGFTFATSPLLILLSLLTFLWRLLFGASSSR